MGISLNLVRAIAFKRHTAIDRLTFATVLPKIRKEDCLNTVNFFSVSYRYQAPTSYKNRETNLHAFMHCKQKPAMHLPFDISRSTFRARVAQLVEHPAVTREVVSSTPAGPTLRVFN